MFVFVGKSMKSMEVASQLVTVAADRHPQECTEASRTPSLL